MDTLEKPVVAVRVLGVISRPSAIDLCSRAGAPLFSAGPGGLRGQIRIPGINLRGTSGSSPFAVTSGPANIDLTAKRWSLALADFQLGEGDIVTRFSAQSIVGRATVQGMAGDLRGASGKIGAVPLKMGEISGGWRWADGALMLDGGLLLTDAAPEARFAPLISNDATLRFADGVIGYELLSGNIDDLAVLVGVAPDGPPPEFDPDEPF